MRAQNGSIELVVLGLIAAMIVVLAIPLLTGFEEQQRNSPSSAAANNENIQAVVVP